MEAEVRGHIGGDTSNPEATPQIPPSCWTSCSLHNRIRMNRPSPALSSLSTPSPSCLLVYTLLALFELGVLSFFPFDTLLSHPFSLFTFIVSFFHSRIFFLSSAPFSFLETFLSLAQRMPLDSSFPQLLKRFAVAYAQKLPCFLQDCTPFPTFPPRVAVSPPFIQSSRR